MIPEIGNFLIVLAILCSLLSLGANARQSSGYANSKIFASLLFLSIFSSFLTLVYAFLISDFSVLNVYMNSSTIKPNIYKISAAWASHEGSIMLFTLILSLVNLILAFDDKIKEEKIKNNANQILTSIIFGLLLIIYFTSTPFGRVVNPPLEGLGLTPSLQDPALAIHPPILYLGYSLYAIPYSLLMSCLLFNNAASMACMDKIKIYSSIAFSALTLGIALGSWWAYRELGWGGYWFFDPVENTSLIPWIMGCVFHHMIMIKENRYMNFTILSGILVFLLCLLGTFLVRSGILVSVHSFAFDITRGRAIFVLFTLVSIVSLGIFAFRVPDCTNISKSKKNRVLVFAMILLCFADICLVIGTLYPPFYKLYFKQEISLDIFFYINIFIPVILVPIYLAPKVLYNSSFSLNLLLFSLLFATVAYFFENIIVVFALSSGICLIVQSIFHIRKKKISLIIAHFGLGLFVVSVSLNSALKDRMEFIGKLDDKILFKEYEIKAYDIKYAKSENYLRQIAKFNIIDKKDNRLFTLQPEQRLYRVEQMAKSKPHIQSFLFSDLYAVLLNVKDDVIHAEFHSNPFIFIMWFSLFLIIISPILSIISSRATEKKD